jgi:16S rRNA (guanine1207-N2)-methyltransferase
MTEPLRAPSGEFMLARWPSRRDDPLRAWDTADQYLLDRLAEPSGPDAAQQSELLIVNDAFGALAVPLAGRHPSVWSDSHLSRLAIEQNLGVAGCAADAITFVPADTEPGGPFSLGVARFPKSLPFWEDALLRLRPLLRPEARVLAGGMIRHTPRRAFELMETIIGPVRTSLGWKKARLAEATVAERPGLPARVADTAYELPGHGVELAAGPNVFARDRLDVGTRALLAQLPAGLSGHLADLGCGNGALALALARLNPEAVVLGVDESYQAVASARANAERAELGPPRVSFEVADGLEAVAAASLDLVVCNPPFHQDRTVGDLLAWRMFSQARRALVARGRLLVVGNRSLGHGRRLERLFPSVRVLDTRGKFEVLEAL